MSASLKATVATPWTLGTPPEEVEVAWLKIETLSADPETGDPDGFPSHFSTVLGATDGDALKWARLGTARPTRSPRSWPI
jgi:hypothetical protein